MRAPAESPRLSDYLRLLAGSWIVIVLVTALSAGAGWLVWHNDQKYDATTRFLVVAPGGAEPADVYYGSLSAMARTPTYQQLARSSQVTMRTIDELKLRLTPEELAKNITVEPTKSAMLEMHVTAPDPNEARDTANSIARNLLQVSSEMEGLDTGATDLVLIDSASGAADTRPSRSQQMLLAGLMGLAISVVLVLAYRLATGDVVDRKQVGHIVDGTMTGKGKA
jgi:capsular polysaccharide biosynthesis protein